MIVDSNQTEFGYELIASVPFAYWLHKNGKLEGVKSCKDTRCLYYFADNHEECYDSRSELKKPHAPNAYIHRHDLDLSMWQPPPYKSRFKNNRFVWKKPLLVVCNKFKDDGRNKIGIELEHLRKIFSTFSDKYTIIYNRPLHKNITHDDAGQIPIGDFDLIQEEFSESVFDINEIYEESKDLSFNTMQMMILANSDRFISCQGGTSILCSYFGGENIIYAYEGKELQCGSYDRWYNRLSGAEISHFPNIEQVIDKAARSFL